MTDQIQIPAPRNPAPQSPSSSGCVTFAGILLVILLPFSILAYDVWRVVFNPGLMKSLITEEVVNSELLPVFLEWFSERRAQERVDSGIALTGVDEPDIVLLLSYMDREDWAGIKREVLTDRFLADLVSVTVDGTYSWIDSEDRVPQIIWDLRVFIERVNSEHGEASLVIAYENLPACTQEEIDDFLARLGAAPPNTEVLYNLCEFPDPWHDDQFSDYKNSLFKVVDNVPEDFALTAELSRVSDQRGIGPEALKTQLWVIRLLAQWAWVLPAALIILIAGLGTRTLPGLWKFEGRPVLIGGILTLVLALVLRPAIIALLSFGLLSEVPVLVREESLRILGKLADAIFNPMLIQSGVLIVLALLLWFLTRSKRQRAG